MKLRHPARGRLTTADEDRAALLRSQGWVEVTSTKACPTCGASGDDPCVTSNGNTAAQPHTNRP